mgnify:CR=1 FL=1
MVVVTARQAGRHVGMVQRVQLRPEQVAFEAQRAQHLVLFGAFARGWLVADPKLALRARALFDLIESGWGQIPVVEPASGQIVGIVTRTDLIKLWGQPIQDATFANVVSDARRGLANLVTPPIGEEWIGRGS